MNKEDITAQAQLLRLFTLEHPKYLEESAYVTSFSHTGKNYICLSYGEWGDFDNLSFYFSVERIKKGKYKFTRVKNNEGLVESCKKMAVREHG
jgi:hypothetical protein